MCCYANSEFRACLMETTFETTRMFCSREKSIGLKVIQQNEKSTQGYTFLLVRLFVLCSSVPVLVLDAPVSCDAWGSQSVPMCAVLDQFPDVIPLPVECVRRSVSTLCFQFILDHPLFLYPTDIQWGAWFAGLAGGSLSTWPSQWRHHLQMVADTGNCLGLSWNSFLT